MTFHDRSMCGHMGASHVGRQVVLAGWVDALRDHGEVLFIHLRDQSGIVQVVFSPECTEKSVCEQAGQLRNEFCVRITGRVVDRTPGTENPHIVTGDVEVNASDLTILSQSETPPFTISEKSMLAGAPVRQDQAVAEDLRLQYRYLDLRRPSMQRQLFKRHAIIRAIRNFLDEQGFIEVETPMLTRSTPEGARDYIVPSRHHPRSFYALPQSPQLFKQLLMVGGVERYYQIVRCFRDEDLRPNRQPEFTQLDLEAAFIDEEFVYRVFEELVARMFAVGGIDLPRPFVRMTWTDAMNTAGSDRPDLRFGMTFVDATDIFTDTNYAIFRQIMERGGCIKGINVKGQSGNLSKNILQNEYAKEIVPGFGARGMTWMRVADAGLESNIVQFFSETEQKRILERFGAETGDVILMIADASWHLVCTALGQLRLHLARRLELIPEGVYKPLWITNFPLFEATDTGVTSSHHPFTMPDQTDFDPTDTDALLDLKSRAYDLVINGEETGGGSIRINDRRLQDKIFQALDLTEEDVAEKFGFFLQALEYGAPPHGGMALGLDRITAMILSAPSIREVIAFPKNRSAFCPLTQAPAPVSREQLAELELLDIKDDAPLPGAGRQKDPVASLSWVSRIGIEDAEREEIRTAVAQAKTLAERVNREASQNTGESAEPLFSVLPASNRFRPGTTARISELSENKRLLENAPAVKGGYFKVASVLGQ
ncbi:MAG: aspartate--tRNA ligase [Desulfobacterales bacterium]|nr:aspartate--tRNA ligase [Desulfobacterales bacterium]